MAEQDANATATPAESQTETTPPAPVTPPAAKTNHLLESEGYDPDLKELEEAEAAVKAEEAAAASGEQPPAETPPAEAPPGGEEEKPAATTQVPVAVVQAERDKRQDAESIARKAVQSAAYWKGVAEGRFPLPGARSQEQEPPAPPKPSRERRTEIRSEIETLAEQVDAGTLTVKDFEKQKGALEDELDDLRLAEIQSAMPKGGDLYLDTMTKQLEDQNPWLANVPDDEISVFTTLAKKDLLARGYDLKGKAGSPEADYQVRCALIDRLKKHGFASSEAPPAPPAPKTPGAKPTPAQVKEKEEIAAGAPPRPKGPAAPAEGWTPERVEEIDSLDLENMSMRDLRRIQESVDHNESARRVHTASRK